jgi:hypothetical protein
MKSIPLFQVSTTCLASWTSRRTFSSASRLQRKIVRPTRPTSSSAWWAGCLGPPRAKRRSSCWASAVPSFSAGHQPEIDQLAECEADGRGAERVGDVALDLRVPRAELLESDVHTAQRRLVSGSRKVASANPCCRSGSPTRSTGHPHDTAHSGTGDPSLASKIRSALPIGIDKQEKLEVRSSRLEELRVAKMAYKDAQLGR